MFSYPARQRSQTDRPLFSVPLLMMNTSLAFQIPQPSASHQLRSHFCILPPHLVHNHFSGRFDIIPHCPDAAPILFRQIRKGHSGASPVKPIEVGQDLDLPEPRLLRDHSHYPPYSASCSNILPAI